MVGHCRSVSLCVSACACNLSRQRYLDSAAASLELACTAKPTDNFDASSSSVVALRDMHSLLRILLLVATGITFCWRSLTTRVGFLIHRNCAVYWHSVCVSAKHLSPWCFAPSSRQHRRCRVHHEPFMHLQSTVDTSHAMVHPWIWSAI
eukprot:6492116-Amphidinium_carterae.4